MVIPLREQREQLDRGGRGAQASGPRITCTSWCHQSKADVVKEIKQREQFTGPRGELGTTTKDSWHGEIGERTGEERGLTLLLD